MNYKTKKGEKAFQGECDLAGGGGGVGGRGAPPPKPQGDVGNGEADGK